MRLGRREASRSVSRCFRWTIVGLALISGGGRSAVAQATTDLNALPLASLPTNPTKHGYAIFSKPSLIYTTARNPTTGIVTLATLETDPAAPDSKPLVVKSEADAKSEAAILVSLTFRSGRHLSRQYYLPTPVFLGSGGQYTVDGGDLNKLLSRFLADLNNVLPPGFSPETPLAVAEEVAISVTPISDIVLTDPLKKTQKLTYITKDPVPLGAKMPLKRLLGKDDPVPTP